MAGLEFKRMLIKDRFGYYRMAIPKEIANYLGAKDGGDIALLIDNKAPVPSVVLRLALEEA
jgi:hypothetical protein